MNKRIESIDFYRGLAVVSVLLFHFNGTLPYGYLGVDLFFVISGFLVGGILIRSYINGKINFWDFILQRGFKIWPSFYFFIFIGGIIAYLIYSNSDRRELYIPLSDFSRYILFYRNFRGEPHHWNFDHIWSLCIEEHFYIILPILLLIIIRFFSNKLKFLYLITILLILSGIIFKNLALFFTNGKDTYSATYNRLDALAYGVGLYLCIQHPLFKLSVKKSIYVILGLTLCLILIYIFHSSNSIYFNKVIFHSLIPLSFSLIIFGTYDSSFKYFKVIKHISKYSYNIYLWHPFFVFIIFDKIGNGFLGLIAYLIISYITGFVVTKLIEEPVLKKRKLIINQILYR